MITIGMLDFTRLYVDDSVVPRDNVYLRNTLLAMENGGVCDVHTTAPYDPSLFDPMWPSTWPPAGDPDYPDFNILDETTWPNYVPPSEQKPSPDDEQTEEGKDDDGRGNGLSNWFNNWWPF